MGRASRRGRKPQNTRGANLAAQPPDFEPFPAVHVAADPDAPPIRDVPVPGRDSARGSVFLAVVMLALVFFGMMVRSGITHVGADGDRSDGAWVLLERPSQSVVASTFLRFSLPDGTPKQVLLSTLARVAGASSFHAGGLEAVPGTFELARTSLVGDVPVGCGRYRLGDEVRLGVSGGGCFGQPFVRGGWAPAEAGGRWTIADKALLVIPLAVQPTAPLFLRADVTSFTALGFAPGQQLVHVTVGGQRVATWTFVSASAPPAAVAEIPPELIHDRVLQLQLTIESPLVPRDLGLNDTDTRPLGAFFRSFVITQAKR